MRWFSYFATLAATVSLFSSQTVAASFFSNQQQQPVSSKDKPPAYDADLFNKDRESYFANLEWLYWTVEEGALDYAQKMKQTTHSAGPYYALGNVKSATFDLDPGLRVSAGYFNAPKYWEVLAEYTYMPVRGKNKAHAPKESDLFLTGTWPQLISTPLTKAHSSISLDYNVFYLMIDRVFIPNPHLRFRTLAGIGAAWIEQNWYVHYSNANEVSKLRNRWNYGAGGLRIGLSGDWYWGNHIYLTGALTLGSFMGSYHNRTNQSSPAGTVRKSFYSDARAALMTQFLIGAAWQKNFTAISRLEVFVGYELTPWVNLQEMRRSSGSMSLQDAKETWLGTSLMTLHGLTTRFTINF